MHRSEFAARFYSCISIVSGVTDPRRAASNKSVAEIQLACPADRRSEQRRIVAKIEELFPELDAIESLNTARRAARSVYRQAVLKYAFEGKLSNARFASHKAPTTRALRDQSRSVGRPRL